MKPWLIVRLVLVTLGFVQGGLSPEVPAPPHMASSLLLVAFGFGVLGMLFVVGIQRINPRSAAQWRYPSWAINPFLFSEPLQFFHVASFFFISGGAGACLRKLALGQELDLSLLFLPTLGVGTLAGV